MRSTFSAPLTGAETNATLILFVLIEGSEGGVTQRIRWQLGLLDKELLNAVLHRLDLVLEA